MSQTPEDDRTVLSTGKPRVPSLAPDSTPGPAQDSMRALAPGTRLSEFEITGVLGEGGFGIVYCAHDNSLERQVALKEYLPSFAWRTGQSQVTVRSAQDTDSFEAGLRSFVNEARMLAQFDHPSLVKVYRFWEANGTAYMVMPYYRGPTLKQALKARETAPDEAWLSALLAPLLDALEVIHQHRCYHRDIAPDNILMLDEGRPLLLDFGAARRAIGGMNQAFTVILKQNYAPIEQYAEMPGMGQGPWTDLYALASVIHFAIDGHAPPPAVTRMVADPYIPLASRYAGRYSAGFLNAIDAALAFRPDARPQDVAAMRTRLGLAQAGTERTVPSVAAFAAGAPVAAPGPTPVAAPVSSAVPAALASPPPTVAKRRPVLMAGAGVVGLAALGLLVFLMRDDATAPAPGRTTPSGLPVARTPPPRPATAPFEPGAALDAVLAGADPGHQVNAQVAAARLRIGVDRFNFSIRSALGGYVYVHMVGTRGDDFHMLFPNALDRNNRIAAGETLSLPRANWRVLAQGPAGTDRFVVIVSPSPRDFSAAGLVEGDPFPDFPLARAAQLQREHAGTRPLFAGTPVCSATPCPDSYGAAAFAIEEVSP